MGETLFCNVCGDGAPHDSANHPIQLPQVDRVSVLEAHRQKRRKERLKAIDGELERHTELNASRRLYIAQRIFQAIENADRQDEAFT